MSNTLLRDIGLALLRIVPSGMMAVHGYSKLHLIVNGSDFADPIGLGSGPSLFLAVLAELVCPILIIFGFKTRLAAIPAAITMLIAAFVVHGADPFQKKELALIYLVIFIAIILLGPGKFSVDKR